MVIRRIAPLSVAKVMGALYALMGLIFGALISLFSLVGAGMMGDEGGFGGMIFGIGAIVILPIFYGVLVFVMMFIAAALYNLVAGWFGGIEIDVS